MPDHTRDPLFIPEKATKSFHPRFYVKYNWASLNWEFYLRDELVLAISEIALRHLVEDMKFTEPRIEVVDGLYEKHLVLRSVPLDRLTEYVEGRFGNQQGEPSGEVPEQGR